MKARATSFAGLSDLKRFIDCLLSGKTEKQCLSVGDNGTGAFGQTTCQLKTPMCAIAPSLMVKKWGSAKAAKGKKIRVRLEKMGHQSPFIVIVADKGPEGNVIDLNPAALIAAGLPSDTQLSIPAEWEWVD